jgi:CRP-like cAMP-binding protein
MDLRSDSVSLLTLPALSSLIDDTPLVEHAPGDHLFRPDALCMSLPVVVSGTARIYARNAGNRQITLYRLRAGALCPLSLSTLLQHRRYPAGAIAETHLQVHYLPGEQLTPLIWRSRETFDAVLGDLADCLSGSLGTARQLMSMSSLLDIRLAQLLRARLAKVADETIPLTRK